MLYCWKLKINWWISVGSTSLNTMWRLSINRIGAGARRHLLRWNSGFSPEANSENVITNFSPVIPVQNRTDETKIMHNLCSTAVWIHKNLRMYNFTIDITIEIYITEAFGCFAPIFSFNCEHFLFVYIMKQKQKKFADLQKISGFSNFYVNRILFEENFWNFDHP